MQPTTAWRVCAVAVGALALASTQTARADDQETLQQQRAAFRAVYPEVERGNRSPLILHEELLRDYALWPDLEAAYLRARLQTVGHADIRSFLARTGMLKPARELRYQFALHLAAGGLWAEYLDIYRQYYQDLRIAKLDCLALDAEINTGHASEVIDRGLALWRVGQSQAEECDPVFDYLRGSGALSEAQYQARFVLAIDARQFSLARYIARSLDGDYLEQANRWLEARDHAARFLANHAIRNDSIAGREQLVYALQQLGFDDPLLAAQHWRDLQDEYPFTDAERHFVARHIALWAARQHLPESGVLLGQLPLEAADEEVLRWRVRAALRREAWEDVLRGIASLPDGEQGTEAWRYWEAVALQGSAQTAPATARLEVLAATRSYYGFLAADATGKDYAFADNRLVPDPSVAAVLMANPALVRARELFHVGLEGRGRSEWDAAVAGLTPTEKTQAALLAHDWGWHSRAIATAADVGEYDDLLIRYPLPWREEFTRYAADARLSDSWVYSVARSESLFMRDIRSGAGAIGVMQLLPSTGRQLAREFRQPYAGLTTLTDSSSNIRLGTRYLQKMFERFGDNPVLAAAAYNAGPLRVETWIPDVERIDARIWIENIPYNETRSYVRRVLTADAIFHWRLTGQTKRISSGLGDIMPATERVAEIHSAE